MKKSAKLLLLLSDFFLFLALQYPLSLHGEDGAAGVILPGPSGGMVCVVVLENADSVISGLPLLKMMDPDAPVSSLITTAGLITATLIHKGKEKKLGFALTSLPMVLLLVYALI